MMLLIFLLLTPLVLYVWIKNSLNSQGGIYPRVPGPKRLPIIGNLHQVSSGHLHRTLHRLSDKYGGLMFLQIGSVPTLVISSGDVTRDFFKSHDHIVSSRPVLYAARKMSYNNSSLAFAPLGDYWRDIKKIVVLELLSSKRVQSFDSPREEEVRFMVDFVESSARQSKPVDINSLTLLLTNRLVCRVAFGRVTDDGRADGKSRFDEILHETQLVYALPNLANSFPSLGWINKFNGFDRRLDKAFRDLDEIYDMFIEEHKNPNRPKSDREDLVDVLLRVQSDTTQQHRLTNDQLKGILTDVFVAGTDTSSVTLTWTMTELIKHPEIMRKVQKEIREAVKGKPKVEESDLQNLPYLKLVIKESLRIHPAVPLLVPRETTEPTMIAGYTIPAKTRILVNVTAINMDPKYWENPTEFKPERFENSSVDFRGLNYELLPFGVGRRGCPGTNFAVVLVELALANLLYRFDWAMPEGLRAEDIDMGEGAGLAVPKEEPLCLVASLADV